MRGQSYVLMYHYSTGPSTVPVSYAPANKPGTVRSGNMHYSAHCHIDEFRLHQAISQILFSGKPALLSRHYRGATAAAPPSNRSLRWDARLAQLWALGRFGVARTTNLREYTGHTGVHLVRIPRRDPRTINSPTRFLLVRHMYTSSTVALYIIYLRVGTWRLRVYLTPAFSAFCAGHSAQKGRRSSRRRRG